MSEPLSPTPEQLRERALELYEQKIAPEKEREISEKEKALKEEIKKIAKTAPAPHAQNEVAKQINELLTLDDREQLSELVKLVYTKDALFAVKVAQGLQNPLIVDTFHDLLASDEMYYKLLKEEKL